MVGVARFALRHWTGTLVALVLGYWVIFYLPTTPSFAVVQLKRAIDARDGAQAAQYVDFESVVKHAGDEMVNRKSAGGDPLSQMLGRGAVELFYKPIAKLAQDWAVQQVGEGAKNLQMPAGAVAGAVVMLHRDGDTAFTKFRDHKGRQWEIHMARNGEGRWQVVEVDNIEQLLNKLQPNQPAAVDAP